MKISLVVPVKDEAASLPRLLRSISAQTHLPDEVIFVDAGSRDLTKEIISGHKDDRVSIKLFSIGDAYPGTARNEGVKRSRNDFIAFTDGGIELSKEWLRELAGTMESGGSCDVAYGSYSPRADTFFKQCLSMAVVPPKDRRTSFIASSLMKKSVWQAVGGFPDFRAAEDRIFMERIKERGFNISYNPKAFVVWDIPSDMRSAYRRFRDYSYHDMMANRYLGWHLPVLKMYVVAIICVMLGILFTPLFFLVPMFGFAARVARKIYVNRREPYIRTALFPLYTVFTGFLILSIDIAMYVGWIRYLTDEK